MRASANALTAQRWRDSDHFRSHVGHWADQIRVKPKRVHVRAMRNKWASCSTGGQVTFSADLLNEDIAFGEYVIVHELLHLKVPNHGKLFKSLLRAYLPGHAPDSAGIRCGISGASPVGTRR